MSKPKIIDAETAKKISDDAVQENKKIAKQLEASKIAPTKGRTKTVVIGEGTDYEYSVVMQFPGVVRASAIRDDAMNPYGNINRTVFAQELIDDIIVSPKINSLEFFETHRGYDELINEGLEFLISGLNGVFDD